MIKFVFALLTVFCLNAMASFQEEGLSTRNCSDAKEDAMQMANANCLGLQTQNLKTSVGNCRKDKQGYYKVKVSYKCDVEVADKDDGYSETIDEALDGTFL